MILITLIIIAILGLILMPLGGELGECKAVESELAIYKFSLITKKTISSINRF